MKDIFILFLKPLGYFRFYGKKGKRKEIHILKVKEGGRGGYQNGKRVKKWSK